MMGLYGRVYEKRRPSDFKEVSFFLLPGEGSYWRKKFSNDILLKFEGTN